MAKRAKKRSGRRTNRRRERRLVIVLLALLVMLASMLYMIRYEGTRRMVLRRNAKYSALYTAPSIGPTETIAPTAPADSPAPAAVEPTPAATAVPTPSPAPTATIEIAVDQTREPLATPDADTVVIAMETPPPVQESFNALLAANPETVGFLTIEDILTLPVVQRANDNEFYLSHAFDLEEDPGGTLFLDGSNLLVPEDDCLIIYGHNMRNGTMFQQLVNYEDPSFMKENALIRFDTLYENRVYVPFAALTVTAEPDSDRYLNLRQFALDSSGFNRFVQSLRALSEWESPVEAAYGDHVLLLVTCEYTRDNGRFVLALRALRDDETPEQLLSQAQQAK